MTLQRSDWKAPTIPNLVKHCVVAIVKGGTVQGSLKDKFLGAWNIARSRLVEYGFLRSGSETGPASKIKLTAKGEKREREHTSEGRMKSRQFDQWWRELEIESETPGSEPDRETADKDERRAESGRQRAKPK